MTATNASRKRRGADTQRIVADHLRRNGWPWAEPVGAGRPGADITGTPGLAFEVKARRGFSPAAWIRQARGRPGLPVVALRLDGQGEASVDEWPVLMRLGDLLALLREAGYGEPEDAR